MDTLKYLAVLFVASLSVVLATKGGGESYGSYYPTYDYREYGHPYSAVPIYSPYPVESYAVRLPQVDYNYEFKGYAPFQRYVEVQEMQYQPSYGGYGGMMMMGGGGGKKGMGRRRRR